MSLFNDELVIVRGAGDLATGIVYSLYKAHFKVIVLETQYPSSIRRRVALSEAVYDGESKVEDIESVLVKSYEEALNIIANQNWFFENVKQPLDREYPQEVSDSAYKYMVIPEKINDWITNQDWTHLNEGPISFQEYYNFYEEVGQAMKSIDYERKENSKLR